MADVVETAFATVYLDCSEELPPHPGSSWTRFVCISDTHSRSFPIPAGDVLLHAGDLSSWGYPQQLAATIEWLKSLPHPTKIIIAGNHDLCLDERWLGASELLSREEITVAKALVRSQATRDAGVQYLEYEAFRCRGTGGREWTVYGCPATPRYASGAFQYTTRSEADEIYDRIPKDTEILLTHTPPVDVLDKTRRGKHAGCASLERRLTQLDGCRLHVFGHIHEAHGACKAAEAQRISVNAAVYWGGRAIVVDVKN